MSKESRLCYHAVPKIVKTDMDWIDVAINETVDGTSNEADIDSDEENKNLKKRRLTIPSKDEYNDKLEETLWNSITDLEHWKPFSDYISDCRINMNVRQVLDPGEQSLNLK